jgi:Zn-dependent M28 family amino/carboxypeptidase
MIKECKNCLFLNGNNIDMRSYYNFLLYLCLATINKSYAHSDIFIINRKHTSHFNTDSAYHFIEQQVNFGPRVPNTAAHKACKKYLKQELNQYADKVYIQKFQATAFNNKKLKLYNIIASFNPACNNRILLAAHWDTRPFADKDTTSKKKPILGANDGASGVGLLLELARIIRQIPSKNLGIDIILFDGEDYGPPYGYKKQLTNQAIYWCLGSQFWSQHPHQKNYTAQYGILLDMVGGKHATFYKDAWSMHYGSKYVNRIWNIAKKLGYAQYFINQHSEQYILDDHYFINKYRHIPTINIIDHQPTTKACFQIYHHTHADNLALIDKSTLQAVGETLLQTIYTNYSE